MDNAAPRTVATAAAVLANVSFVFWALALSWLLFSILPGIPCATSTTVERVPTCRGIQARVFRCAVHAPDSRNTRLERACGLRRTNDVRPRTVRAIAEPGQVEEPRVVMECEVAGPGLADRTLRAGVSQLKP